MSAMSARVYDALFLSGQGLDGHYDDGVTQTPCRLLRYAPDASRLPVGGFQVGELGIAESRRYLLVRSSEVAAPAAGGLFTITAGGSWRIGEDHPIAHDDDAYVWRCAVTKEA